MGEERDGRVKRWERRGWETGRSDEAIGTHLATTATVSRLDMLGVNSAPVAARSFSMYSRCRVVRDRNHLPCRVVSVPSR